MKMIERSRIARPLIHVWPYIVTPEHFKTWNEKIQSMDTSSPFAMGQIFTTHYRMGQKGIRCTTTVTKLIEGHELELLHTNPISIEGPGPSKDMQVTERITLQEKGNETLIVKEVTISHHHTNIFVIALFWLISRFGKRVGPDKLKKLCEQNS